MKKEVRLPHLVSNRFQRKASGPGDVLGNAFALGHLLQMGQPGTVAHVDPLNAQIGAVFAVPSKGL
jgi:hypothetical protein